MIPKIVHVCWDDKEVLNHSSPLIQHGLANMQRLNPDWDIQINTAQEVDAYLQQVLDPHDLALLSGTHIVERSDLWRLFKIYNTGGVYTDIDRFCNVSFASMVMENTRWVLPTQNEFDFSQDFMLSAPGNPVFKTAIDMVLERRRSGVRNTYHLGPQTYMHAITQELCGFQINTDPGAEVFALIRETIDRVPFIVTYRENGPLDTVIYRSGDQTLDFSRLKQEFYDSYGIVHWTLA